jgi:hypothetical protein
MQNELHLVEERYVGVQLSDKAVVHGASRPRVGVVLHLAVAHKVRELRAETSKKTSPDMLLLRAAHAMHMRKKGLWLRAEKNNLPAVLRALHSPPSRWLMAPSGLDPPWQA